MSSSKYSAAKTQLATYGYSLQDDGIIVAPRGNRTSVKVLCERGAYKAVAAISGNVLWTGRDLGNFVSRFWFAKPVSGEVGA